MSKKYHAVCVGRQPGLYTQWEGPDGAEQQKTGIKGYDQKLGMKSTNDFEEAVQFLKSNPIRKVKLNFFSGIEMTFDELARTDSRLSRFVLSYGLDSNTPIVSVENANVKQPAAAQTPHLNSSCVLRAPVSGDVNSFCSKYHFTALSEDQRRAVQAVNGKYLLFAVPGSGKTTVMMARAGYMVHACGIPAGQLMTMTFTRASAQEMRDRYHRYFPDDAYNAIPDFRTIHSFCKSIVIRRLKTVNYACPNHVINEHRNDGEKKYTSRAIMTELLKKHGVRKYTDESVQEMVQSTFSSIKNRRMKKDECRQYAICIEKKLYAVSSLYEDYLQMMKELDCMDYDDMLIIALEGLQAKPQVLREIQDTYHYWSIDEAQDNSCLQNELLDLLSGPGGNLFMVGDDDQSIYSFRGAEPRMLLDYGNRKDVQQLSMGTNYRSDAAIVETAKAFVEHNHRRADKQMKPSHTQTGMIRIPPAFPTEAELYANIDRAAQQAQEQGKRLGILYQLNASAFPLLVHMHRKGIPFESSKGLSELLTTKVISRLICVLRFAAYPNDLKLFEKCRKALNLLSENKEQKERLEKAHHDEPNTPILELILAGMEYDDKHYQNVSKAARVLGDAYDKAPSEALSVILKGFAKELYAETLSERLYVYGVLSVCDLYDTVPHMLSDLDAMKKREKFLADLLKEDSVPEENADSAIITAETPVVSLSTIHSAKGREWNHVILIDAFETAFPGKAPQPERIGYDSEEASRLFYVAVTRAINQLDILTVDEYHGNSEQVSSFISQFAHEADRVLGHPVEDSIDYNNIAPGVICKLEPGRYYSVPIGSKPGVYTEWSEVEEIKKGLSIPPEMQPKVHDTYAEAWQRVFPGQPVPRQSPDLCFINIRKHIKAAGGAAFNDNVDIPDEVYRGLYNYLHADSLLSLPPERIEQIRQESRFAWNTAQTNYHGKADGYTFAYMGVNFYKIWLPLWKLLEKNQLPYNPSILEIGPGPGTSTWSLIAFYKRLALDNPTKHFSLKYTAIEKETDFSPLFLSIQQSVFAHLPNNMSVCMNHQDDVDAFKHLGDNAGNNDIDLIIESNVLNAQEAFNTETIAAYLTTLRRWLSPKGFAILVEPREKPQTAKFERFIDYVDKQHGIKTWCKPAYAAVNTSGIQMVRDAVKANVRYSRITEHWFSYAILIRNMEG